MDSKPFLFKTPIRKRSNLGDNNLAQSIAKYMLLKTVDLRHKVQNNRLYNY